LNHGPCFRYDLDVIIRKNRQLKNRQCFTTVIRLRAVNRETTFTTSYIVI